MENQNKGGGLLNAPQAPAAPPGEDPAVLTEDFEQAGPEEQQAYEAFVANGLNLLFDEKTFPQILARLQGDTPAHALAQTVSLTVQRLQEDARKNGMELSGAVLLHGGKALIEQLADAAAELGAKDFSEAELESVFYSALDMYRRQAAENGLIDESALKQDWQTLMAGNETGAFDQMLAQGFAAEEAGVTEQAAAADGVQGNRQQRRAAQSGAQRKTRRGKRGGKKRRMKQGG